MKGVHISMKKFVCLLLTICMVLGVFSGCRKDYHESVQVSIIASTETAEEVITAATTEPGLTTEMIEMPTEAPTEVPAEPEPAEATGTPGVIRDIENADAVNVRENAGGNYKIVTQLEEGTEITVYEIVTVDGGKEWGRIDQGWILMDLVQLNGSEPSTDPT